MDVSEQDVTDFFNEWSSPFPQRDVHLIGSQLPLNGSS